jgi:type II secretory pathway pseudopilin PulG
MTVGVLFVRRKRQARAFTLIEVMVVAAISLSMVLMIAMTFNTGTRAVKGVERKLAVYEAARNILDIIHVQLLIAVSNERGEQFSIKSAHYKDNDPFTPDNPDPDARYAKTSRREADGVQFLSFNSGSNAYREDGYIPGSQVYPISYPGTYHTFPECYKISLRSSLLYPKLDDWDNSGQYKINASTGDFFSTPTQLRNDQLNDISQIELTGLLESTNNEIVESWSGSSWTDYHLTPKDTPPNFFAPGNEPKLTHPIYSDIGRKNQQRISGFNIMDLDIAYWDEKAQHFVDPPDDKVIYFAPPPKAVRVTITVCDIEKRASVTLSRVVQLLTGNGPASGSGAPGAWIQPDDGNYSFTMPPLNMPKDLKKLQSAGIEPALDLP